MEIFDGLSVQDRKYLDHVKLDRTDISDGVISDYVKIIEYLADRHHLKTEKIVPTPFFPQPEAYSQVVLFYKGQYKIDNFRSKTHPSEWCRKECETILLDSHAESVLRVQINVETLKAVPDSVRKFQKANTCDAPLSLKRDPSNLHPCLTMTIPDNGAELLAQEGLYVYDEQVSPLWPDVFFIDGSKLRRDGGIHAISYTRPIEAFNYLKHVKAYSTHDSKHRLIIEKRNELPNHTSILRDNISLSISPRLPKQIIDYLIKETVGEEYFSDVEQDGEIIWTFDPGEINLGNDYAHGKGLFAR